MEQLIVSYGLAAIFVLMLAESACMPIPSEVTMLLGGALAAGAVTGAHLNLGAVIAAGTLGNVVGSYLAWWVGRRWGRAALDRWGRYVWLRPGEVERAQEWFVRRGAASVFWARLLPGIRTFISLPAGVAGMSVPRFGVYTLAGCLPWTAALAIAGYLVGAHWRDLAAALRGPSYGIAAAAMVVVGVVVYRAARRRRPEAWVTGSDTAAESRDCGGSLADAS